MKLPGLWIASAICLNVYSLLKSGRGVRNFGPPMSTMRGFPHMPVTNMKVIKKFV